MNKHDYNKDDVVIPQDTVVSSLSKYLYILQEHRGRLIWMILLFLVLSGLDLLGVGLIGPFIGMIVDSTMMDTYTGLNTVLVFMVGDDSTDQFTLLGLILLFVFLIKGVTAYLVQRRIFKFSFGFRAHLIRKLMDAYLRMPYSFYLERNSSTILQSVTYNTKIMTDDLVLPSMRFISDIIIISVMSIFLFWISPTAMLFLAIMLGSAVLLYSVLVKPHVKRAGKVVTTTHEHIIRGVNQGIGGIKEVRVLGVEKPFYDEVARETDIHTDAQISFYSLLSVPRYLIETTMIMFVVFYALYVNYFTNDTAQLFSVLAMFGVAGLRLLPAISSISTSVASMSYSLFAMNEVYNDLLYVEQNTPTKELNSTLHSSFTAEFDGFELKNISFKYPKAEQKAIEDISLCVKRGGSIGLIGSSGSGKTTLVDLLLGMHNYDTGEFNVNGKSINQFGWDNWLSHVAYIPQSVFLIDDTLEKNIAFGILNSEINDTKLEQAISDAQLSELVNRLPEGKDTVLGEDGIRLSGGERQRIALARAFYHDRDIFIFDEATSALDTETEKQVTDVIDKLHGNKTLIVIAHRLTTVKGCDVIYRLNEGRIIESGSYEEVIGNE